ncbi:MAG: efflux RND transporter permease subunit [Phenylobacterium sp.]|uniref:efflux RND transporter permease subunit n=1 Tax=Phenylobacterium sp. TaxID=1871053 RepID=UPI002721012B|nr:efflux RND transporter permease subunit [Phenylobacterium sp.]MDO8912571.1 efflux RND transporter permease subunit [Phenylobacterium sp.]MDP3101628.1 efflux RND transporter permease subunit [Phenylobacterium sp.]
MIERVIELSVRFRWAVLVIAAALAIWAADSARKTPLDALPDLSDPQVIVYTEWMGRSPDLIEDQITYPLIRALQSTPSVRTVRGYSMFGMSFVYVIFEDGTDVYWARTRVLEQLGRVQQLLPPAVVPTLGPDASGVGWVYQYVLEDKSGRLDLAELRALQDFTVRPALQAVPGVAEVASIGGFERQYQVVVDPERLVGFGLTMADLTRAVRDANAEVGARVLELAGREYVLRGRGFVRDLEDLEKSVVTVGPGGVPIRLGDVATVRFGPEIRRGAADWNARGEAVGGIVVMRIGSNALQVIDRVKVATAELSLPPGVRLVPTYDRSDLIRGSVETLRNTLISQGVIVTLICVVFLFHLRSALVVMIVLPVSVLLSFIGIRYLGLTTNIMSLGGIAIAIGELADATIVLVENANTRLAAAPPGADRRRIIIDACKEVGRPIFFSLLLITVSFLPIFTLAGQAGDLFAPLAFTKTFAMFAAAILSVTLAPALMVLLLRGRFRTEAENPVGRALTRAYLPIARFVVHYRIAVVCAAALLMIVTVPVFQRLGSEFMPPLDEGSLLVMPTTFPGIAIEDARRALEAQHRVIMNFPEVASVHGKTGRAETATDPAQLDMNESVVTLRPWKDWPLRPVERWYSAGAPDGMKPLLRLIWPDRSRRTLAQLSRDLDAALRMPGYQMAIAPPIRTRIDMLTTGVRTPVGVKVFGEDLNEIERISVALEGMLRDVPGTRSTFAERQTGREYIDIIPDRDRIARHGLTVRDVQDTVEAAIGGANVSTAIAGRARFTINLRYAADFRGDPEALRALLIPVQASGPPVSYGGAGSGAGASPAAPPRVSAPSSGGGMGGMGGASDTGMAGAAAMGSAPSSPRMGGAPASASSEEVTDRYRPPGASVPLGQIADIRVTTGPPMIKDENGVLVGYVYADIDPTARDLGGWVEDAKTLVDQRLKLPPGYRLQWTGQYEFLAEMEARLRYVLPLTLLLIVVLLYLSTRGWMQTLLVLCSLPFAIAGSVWLLAAMDYNMSAAVWVGIIAVAGVAAQTGIVMIVYLDEAFERHMREGKIRTPDDVDAAVVEGAAMRVRPLVMTVATTVLGLMPLLWEAGVGADVAARTAAPVVGGLWSCMVLTLLVLPAAYSIWRRRQVMAAGPPAPEAG